MCTNERKICVNSFISLLAVFSTCYCDLHVYQVSPLNFVHFDGQGTSDCLAIHTALGCQFDYSNLTLKGSTVVIYLKV